MNAMNGKPVIRFNGTSSSLTLPTSTTLGIQSNPYEMFIAAQSNYTAQPEFLIAGGATEQFEYHLNGAPGARFIPITGTYLDEGTSGAYADGKPHVFEANASSSGGGMSVDGVNGGTSVSNILSSNAANLQLGVRSDGTYHFNGDIAEVILYNTVLTSAQRDSVEQYLSNTYGISSGALPVELATYTANNVEGKVDLQWSTATEINCYGFEVQRTNPPLNPLPGGELKGWVAVGFVKGSGNSNSPKSYFFVDDNPLTGSAEYRLKEIDNDGSYKYSNTVEASFMKPTKFSLSQNYPNPFNPTTTIKYDLPKDSKVLLEVYNIMGQKVSTLVNEMQQAGSYSVQFDTQQTTNNKQLSSGIYFYRITAGNFTAVKKLLLLK